MLSEGAAGFHTTVKVGKASTAQKSSEEGSHSQEPTKKPRRQKKKANETEAMEVDAKPRKPRGTTTQVLSDNPAEKAAKRTIKPTRRLRASTITVPDLGAGVELPPVESWHDIFPVWRERTKHSRAIIRELHTADMLAEAFVPEGSKDMTVIEVSPGICLLRFFA
jgi:transcription factor 1